MNALQGLLAQIASANADPGLSRLIANAVETCHELRRGLDLPDAGDGGRAHVVDMQVFERLMSLAGPAMADELITQVLLDLSAVEARLPALCAAADAPGIRAQCHVLVAVAGSVGAHQVQADAEALQAAAVRDDKDGMAALSPPLLANLSALIAFVAAEKAVRSTR